jgi:hypothetical protein
MHHRFINHLMSGKMTTSLLTLQKVALLEFGEEGAVKDSYCHVSLGPAPAPPP